MTHPPEKHLIAWLNGSLDEERVDEVKSHVQECTQCDETVTNLEALQNTIVNKISGAVQSDSQLATTTKPLQPKPLQIGQYEILSKLGEGGMGAVYEAVHQKLDKKVALKLLPQGRMKNQAVVDRFEREMKAVGRLDHPNIVRAMDAGVIDDTHFLVMEIVDGADLNVVLGLHGPLRIADACEIIRQAAVGLDEADHCGMVHRDIKPSNLMLARVRVGQPVVKILDMGLALLSTTDEGEELTMTGQVMGTVDYMSPEQCDDSHKVDIRSDIYSLGATLFKLLSGHAPFGSQRTGSPVKRLLDITTKPPPLLSTLRADAPDDLVKLTNQMLAKRPEERPASPAALVGLIEPFTGGHNLQALLEDIQVNKGMELSGQELSPTHSILSFDETTAFSSDPPPEAKQEVTPEQLQSPIFPKSVVEEPILEKSATVSRQLWFRRSNVAKSPRKPNHVWLIGLGMFVTMLAAAGITFFIKTDDGSTVRFDIDDPNIQVSFDDHTVTIDDEGKVYEVTPGDCKLQVSYNDLSFQTTELKLGKGEHARMRVSYDDQQLRLDRSGKIQTLKPQKTIQPKPIKPIASEPIEGVQSALQFNVDSDVDNPHTVTVPTLKDTTESLTVELWTQRDTSLWKAADRARANMSIANFGGWQNIRTSSSGLFELSYDHDTYSKFECSEKQLGVKDPVHLAMVRDAQQGEVRFFANGVLIGNQKANIFKQKDSFGLLTHQWQGSEPDFAYMGWIDEVRVSGIARYRESFTPARRFENDANTRALYHFDEGTGDVLNDSSGNGHHGKIIGAKWVRAGTDVASNTQDSSGPMVLGPKVVETPAGTALKMTPGEGVIIDSLADKTESLTMECWLQSSKQVAHVYLIGPSHGYGLRLGGSGQIAVKGPKSAVKGRYELGQPTPFPTNQMIHVAIVRDAQSTEHRLYVDGQLNEKVGTIGTPREGHFLICGKERQFQAKKGLGFDGLMDEIRISSSARYQGDRFTPERRFEPDDQTIALYHCDEIKDDLLLDASGNGHHGKIIGAEWRQVDSKVHAPAVLSTGGDTNRSIDGVNKSPHREAVELVLRRGTKAVVLVEGQRMIIHPNEAIPAGPFELRGVLRSHSSKTFFDSINDQDCKRLASLGTIDELDLSGTPVTATGLKEFASSPNLLALAVPRRLENTETIVGLFPNLRFLWPPWIGSDKCLVALRGNASIEAMTLYRTDVTEKGIAELANLPNLKYLYLETTPLKSRGKAIKLLANLPSLETLFIVTSDKVTVADLEPLRSIKTLNTISLHAEDPSRRAEFDVFVQTALPHCKNIRFSDWELIEQVRQDAIGFDR